VDLVGEGNSTSSKAESDKKSSETFSDEWFSEDSGEEVEEYVEERLVHSGVDIEASANWGISSSIHEETSHGDETIIPMDIMVQYRNSWVVSYVICMSWHSYCVLY